MAAQYRGGFGLSREDYARLMDGYTVESSVKNYFYNTYTPVVETVNPESGDLGISSGGGFDAYEQKVEEQEKKIRQLTSYVVTLGKEKRKRKSRPNGRAETTPNYLFFGLADDEEWMRN